MKMDYFQYKNYELFLSEKENYKLVLERYNETLNTLKFHKERMTKFFDYYVTLSDEDKAKLDDTKIYLCANLHALRFELKETSEMLRELKMTLRKYNRVFSN